MLVDTHAHLQWSSYKLDREEVLDRARRAGVKSIVNIGFDIESSKQGVELAQNHEGLYAAVGVHPHNAKDLDNHALRELRKLSENRKVVAIGEIGLDYYRNLSPKEAQKWAFEAQMKMAKELGLPIVVHDRNAHADIIEMLSKHGKMKGIMHCFSVWKRFY
jgi:TatD DNase family protein